MTEATKLNAKPHTSWLLWHFIEERVCLSPCSFRSVFLNPAILHHRFVSSRSPYAILTSGASWGREVLKETWNLTNGNVMDVLWRCNVSILICQHRNTWLGKKVFCDWSCCIATIFNIASVSTNGLLHCIGSETAGVKPEWHWGR